MIPLPFLHYEITSSWLEMAFDFTTCSMLDFVIAQESQLPLNGSLIIPDL